MIRLRVTPLESIPSPDASREASSLDAELLASIADALRASYGIEVEVTEPLATPDFAYDPARKQFNSPEILKWLLALHAQSAIPIRAPALLSPDLEGGAQLQHSALSPSEPSRDREGADGNALPPTPTRDPAQPSPERERGVHANPQTKILAVTNRDLYIPMLSFVYGQAQLDGIVGIVSMARLRTEFYGLTPDTALLDVRARKEAIHETGHLFGLLHCPDSECAMSLSTGVTQLDRKQPSLCAGCAALASGKRQTLEHEP